MELQWLFLLISMKSIIITESIEYEAEITVEDYKNTNYLTAFHTCQDTLQILIKFNNNLVTLNLQHNLNLPFKTIPVVLLEGKNKARRPNTSFFVHLSETICSYHEQKTNAVILLQMDSTRMIVDGRFSYKGNSYHVISVTGADLGSVGVVEDLGQDFTYTKEKTFLHFNRKKRSVEKESYVVELLVVTDFSIYERWYARSDKETPEEKSQDALEQIKYYFAHILNDIDLRLKNIDSPYYNISLTLSGYVIATTKDASPWTEDFRQYSAGKKDRADIDKSLEEFTDWVNENASLPEFDHAMLFTDLDLYSENKNGKEDDTKIGRATVGTICQYHRVSIIEDRGRFASGTTATHELGHSLGAKHDEENNTCSASDHYIMMPMIGSSALNYSNIYKFSPCSIQEIYNVVSKDSSDCLLEEKSVNNATSYSNYLEDLPGQRYDVHDQCRAIYGEQSYYCGAQQYSGHICKSIICQDSTRNVCYILGDTPAAMGTTCGNKKWCFQGSCVYDERAPEVNEDCVFGDYQGLLVQNTLTCKQLIEQQPMLCYLENNRNLCCASCAKLRSAEKPGCEYGDRAGWCPHIRPKDCYRNDQVCCETCPKHNTTVIGCEYGDLAQGCVTESCSLESNLEICCGTCGPSPVLTSSATSTEGIAEQVINLDTNSSSSSSSSSNNNNNDNVKRSEDEVEFHVNTETTTEKISNNSQKLVIQVKILLLLTAIDCYWFIL